MEIKEFESEVLAVKQETPSIKIWHFSVPEDFSFLPAQYIGLVIKLSNGETKAHAFSVASSPTRLNKGYIVISKRIGESDYSQALDTLKKGDTVIIKGPYGRYLFNEDKDAVMLSGGIGITPLMDMIEYATDKELKTKITLLFSNRTPEEIPFKKELDSLQKQNPNLKIIHTITRPSKEWRGVTGRIGKEMIKKYSDKLPDKVFYICGPIEMVNSFVEMLKEIGISEEQIKKHRSAAPV